GGTTSLALQVLAANYVIGMVLYFRYLSLEGEFAYTSLAAGLALIAFATFGGYNWKYVLAGASAYGGLALYLEVVVNPDATDRALQQHLLHFALPIAILGAFTNEVLTRLAWLYYRYAEHLSRTDALTGLSNRLEGN